MKILIAEDNNHLRELLYDFLTANHYEVNAYENGKLAYEAFQENIYDLVLLDIMMPEMDGFTLCKKIRQSENVPILFITAKVNEQDQLQGYALGCDDYIIKPFSLQVLLAKCKVLLERNNRTNTIRQGVLTIHTDTQIVTLQDKVLTLSNLDYKLLEYLIKNNNQILTREQILNKVWGFDYEGNDRSVDTHIKNLRKLLLPFTPIKTIIKTGYKFETKELEL